VQAHLGGLRPRSAWFSYFGAVGGCLDYLGIDVSDAWLYGGTGWGFVFCMSADVDPAAPIAWDGLCVNACSPTNPGVVARLQPNLGYKTRCVCGCPHGGNRELDQARKQAWDLVRASIDQGSPCIGYELADPGFFVIAGYTDDEYLFVSSEVVEGTADRLRSVRWSETTPIVGWVRVQAILPGTPAEDATVVREALRAVTDRMNREPDGGMFVVGLSAYDLWAAALESGAAGGFGHRHSAAAYAELRSRAVGFLREAKERLPGHADGLFDEAAEHYAVAADKLQALHALHPPMDVEDERIGSEEAASLVRGAAAAERRGFPLLARIAEALA